VRAFWSRLQRDERETSDYRPCITVRNAIGCQSIKTYELILLSIGVPMLIDVWCFMCGWLVNHVADLDDDVGTSTAWYR